MSYLTAILICFPWSLVGLFAARKMRESWRARQRTRQLRKQLCRFARQYGVERDDDPLGEEGLRLDVMEAFDRIHPTIQTTAALQIFCALAFQVLMTELEVTEIFHEVTIRTAVPIDPELVRRTETELRYRVPATVEVAIKQDREGKVA